VAEHFVPVTWRTASEHRRQLYEQQVHQGSQMHDLPQSRQDCIFTDTFALTTTKQSKYNSHNWTTVDNFNYR